MSNASARPLANANGHADDDDSPVTNGALHRTDPAASHSPPSGDSIPAHFAALSLRLVLTGAGLGLLIGASLVLAAASPSSVTFAPQFWVYLASWGLFHTMEFVVTARWNPTRLMKDSFLLQNGWNYHAAHAGGMLEFLLESHLLPTTKRPFLGPTLTSLGLLMILVGQVARSLSMIQAANNFSHQVASKKRQDHILVKTGLYGVVRHPSYSGFYLWAVGTQVLLGNPVGIVVFLAVLWRFFSSRIASEEEYLISFFGQEYRQYKREVWSGIPLVS